jgi:hypothetical protein
MWIRTCQECGRNQEAKQPIFGETLTDSYMFSKCKHCKSEALNYGSEHQVDCKVKTAEWNDMCSCVNEMDSD